MRQTGAGPELALDPRQAFGIQRAQRIENLVRHVGGLQVAQQVGQVANAAFGVQKARAFVAQRSPAKQSHGAFLMALSALPSYSWISMNEGLEFRRPPPRSSGKNESLWT